VNESNTLLQAMNDDPYLGPIVAFPCNSKVGNIPFELKKRSRSCQICQYELKQPKWKDVVFCSKHGVQLCLGVSPPRQLAAPGLVKEDGSDVTDFSWTSQIEGNCWDKFHQFYLPKGLFNSCNIDSNQRKIKFGQGNFPLNLYQKKL
jgi:hypothetical protein